MKARLGFLHNKNHLILKQLIDYVKLTDLMRNL